MTQRQDTPSRFEIEAHGPTLVVRINGGPLQLFDADVALQRKCSPSPVRRGRG